jgi:hypothetical protein
MNLTIHALIAMSWAKPRRSSGCCAASELVKERVIKQSRPLRNVFFNTCATQAFGGTRGILEDSEALLFLENVGAQGKLPDSSYGENPPPIRLSPITTIIVSAENCKSRLPEKK